MSNFAIVLSLTRMPYWTNISFAVSDDSRARILACTDTEQLAAWIRKAVTTTSVEELF